jgi:hypothetical protein
MSDYRRDPRYGDDNEVLALPPRERAMSDPAQEQRVEVRPDPDIVRGHCPACDEEIISEARWDARGHRYVVWWACWGKLNGTGCGYERPF